MVEWITEDGTIDLGQFPIDQTLKNALDPDFKVFRNACRALQSMHIHAKEGAGVYLLGLLHHYKDDLQRLVEVVECLQLYQTKQCAEALIYEVRRVKSSNTTRRYISTVLKALSIFPLDMVEDGLTSLSEDKRFTPRMRKKFLEQIDDMQWEQDL